MLCDKTVRQLLSQYKVFLQQEERIAAGFSSMAMDGKQKVEKGDTVMEEITAVLGPQL